MDKKAYILTVLFTLGTLALTNLPVISAQSTLSTGITDYTTDGGNGTGGVTIGDFVVGDNGEYTYTINQSEPTVITIRNTGCRAIQDVKITTIAAIDSEVKISSATASELDEELPEGFMDYAICKVEIDNDQTENISKIELNTRVRNNWLDDNKNSSNSLALIVAPNWTNLGLKNISKTTTYSYYNSEVEVQPETVFAIGLSKASVLGEEASSSFPGNINPLIVVIACVTGLLLALILFLLLSFRRKDEEEGEVNNTYNDPNTY